MTVPRGVSRPSPRGSSGVADEVAVIVCAAGRDATWADERLAPLIAMTNKTRNLLGTVPGNNFEAFFRILRPWWSRAESAEVCIVLAARPARKSYERNACYVAAAEAPRCS